jgi:hypothetical protein
MVKLW